MANKITHLFNKRKSFPKNDKISNTEIREMFDDLHDRLTDVEKDLKWLMKDAKNNNDTRAETKK